MATYTIIIAKQKGEYFIYPGSTTSWDLQSDDKINIVNKTGSEVTVILNPEGWLDLTSMDIAAFDKVTGPVQNIKDYKAPLEFAFSISTQEVFVVTGGPKMVPTDPAF